jgi:DedD protein
MDVTEPHHEPSYYEIALTNRQVVVAFVILLACLLAAFFSGVWIGRGGIEPRRDQVVRATPPQPPAEGRTLEELKFFADRPTKKGAKPEEKPAEKPAEPAPSPAAKAPETTTLQQDLGEHSRPAPTPPPPTPSVVRATPPLPAPAPEEVAEPARPEPVQARPTPADRSARGKAPAAAAAADTETAQPGAGSVVIQVFASADPAEAQKVRERLAKGGQTAFLSPLTVDGHTMYRVRIGPFGTRQKAQKVAEKVRKTFKLDTWLTE